MTSQRIWLITGVSSGFGRELTTQLLERGDRVVGTVRDMNKVSDLTARHPEAFHLEVLDVTDTAAIHDVVDRTFEQLGRIDVVVSNAGYGLSGAAEELTDAQVEHIIATNLTGSIQLIGPPCGTCADRGWPHHPDLVLPRAGRIPRQRDVPRHEVGYRRPFGHPLSRSPSPSSN